MNVERVAKSRLGFWFLAVVVGLPLLYILTYPVVVIETRRFEPGAHWRSSYMKPYKWLHNHTPLKPLLSAYDEWWIGVLKKQ